MIQSKPTAVTLATVLLLLAWLGTCMAGEGDSLLTVIPLEHVMAGPEFDSYNGLVISENAMLVLALTPHVGRLGAAAGVEVLHRRLQKPLWITQGDVPEELAADLGIAVLSRTAAGTIFEADWTDAYDMLMQGYFVVEVELGPISKLKRRPVGVDAVERLIDERPLTAARLDFMRLASGAVDSLRLWESVSWLSRDPDSGESRSRFAARPEVEEDVVPYLEDLLRSYIEPSGGWVRKDEFDSKLGHIYVGGDSTFTNIIAGIPGTKTNGYYVICAHYDAIAVKSSAWDWQTDPAPGADDNGTGTAAVLECARVLSDLDLDVGIVFALFSGEELGLRGSKSYVDLYAPTDTILGVVNFDMVGYVEGGRQIEVWYDWKSGWLYSMVEDVVDSVGGDLAVVPMFTPGIQNSDHASFWAVGIPAVMLIERSANWTPVNPYYHTVGDTLGHVSIDQVRDATKLVVAALSRFAPVEEESLPDVELTTGSIEWDWDGRGRSDWPVGGDQLTARVRAVNVGASMEASEVYDFEVRQAKGGSGNLVYRGTEAIELLSGAYTDIEATWEIDIGAHGYVAYTFVLMPQAQDVEGDTSNNSAEAEILVMAPNLLIDEFRVQPNPVVDPSEAKLSFFLTHPETDFNGRMRVWVFDLLGAQIGYGLLEKTPTSLDIDIGENEVYLSEFLSAGADLAPGLYLCVAELRLIGEPGRASARFRFAVAR